MCGILCVFGSQEEEHALRQRIVKLQAKLRHRGPDWSGLQLRKAVNGTTNALAHERLAIVDLVSGEQPLENETGEILLSANGEIYNHKILAQSLTQTHQFKTHSDCEVIIHLYEEIGAEVPTKLDGMFSFVLYDHKNQNVVAARDPLGITPLYFGHGEDGSVWFASEMKSLVEVCPKFEEFPPGHVWTTDGGLKRWYYPSWWNEEVPTTPVNMDALRNAFEGAVVKRLMTDVPYGVLLSGGLDSSLVASVASRHAAKRVEEDEKCDAWWPKLHSFSIGLPGSPDLKNAALVAKFLGTVHHEWTFTVQQGIDALPDVIYHIESYDVTTIRASTPMYLMARRIKAMGVKMVLSGEGSDEVFGGYLYFHKAPNPTELHKETCRKLKALHSYDLLRANKAMAAWGVEARVPFLDQKFLSLAMGFDPKDKMITKERMEKWVIRKTFDTPEKPYLPDSVLWRQKEQFSDGVGYGWIDGLKAYAETKVTDSMLAAAKHKFPENTPVTKEGYLYRSIFERYFPSPSAVATIPGGPSVACSTAAAVEWDKAWKANLDPSGRAVVGVHVSAYNGSAAK